MKRAFTHRSGSFLLTVGVALAIGFGLRWWILGTSLGQLSADEAYTGLQAFRILDGDRPIVIEGQAYTAVLDSYLLAPIIALFGASVLVLKWLTAFWWLAASVVVGTLASRIAGPREGILAAIVCWLAPGSLLVLSTRGYEGYGLGLLVTMSVAVLARRSAEEKEPRIPTSVLLGLCSGLVLYIHPMYAATALPMVLVPAWIHRRRLRSWMSPALLGAVAINIPFLAWNARNEWASFTQPTPTDIGYIERLFGLFGGLLPRSFGLRDGDGSWVLPWPITALVGVSLLASVIVGFRHLWAHSPGGRVLAAPLVACWPIMALFSNLAFVADGRYGIIPFPFIVIAFAVGLGLIFGSDRWVPTSSAAILLWVVLLIVPWLGSNAGSRIGDPNSDVEEVIEVLESAGVDKVSGSFWWVLPVEYLSGRQIRGAVTGTPFAVRVIDSQTIVTGTPDAEVAYVFAVGDEQTEVLRSPVDSYRRVEVGAAVVYLPIATD
ncbi:MAG: hypothetical protein B7C54_01655 [Acidimicrobiales bacterium mtb01]|nr:hypothetical protein [Actinomycetota bacterium]TEX47796.1 MAG: hypothetical protein B7C54_01655 [Acidimicrobiales bacterium mtb01]